MEHSRGPEIVAEVFKVVAVLALIAGVLGALAAGLELAKSSSTTTAIDTAVAIALGGAFTAASISFFGYVLEVLTQIRDATEVSAGIARIVDIEETEIGAGSVR